MAGTVDVFPGVDCYEGDFKRGVADYGTVLGVVLTDTAI